MSTLMGCLADVSMKMHPRCFARSRPSRIIDQSRAQQAGRRGYIPILRTGETRWRIQHGIVYTGGVLQQDSLLTVHADLALVLEIALVSDEHHGEVVLVLDPKDLLMKLIDVLERFSSGY